MIQPILTRGPKAIFSTRQRQKLAFPFAIIAYPNRLLNAQSNYCHIRERATVRLSSVICSCDCWCMCKQFHNFGILDISPIWAECFFRFSAPLLKACRLRGRPQSTSRYFWPILTPLPCHTLSHIPGPPESMSHISDPPPILVGLVQKPRTKVPCTNSISIVRGGYLSGGFCPGWFLSVPPSVTIHLLQQKVKHHFKFHV